MRIRSFEIEATPEELDSSTVLSELLDRLAGQPAAETADDDRVVAPSDVEADDAAAELADAEAAETLAPDPEDAIPGVAAEGQDAVRALLDRNSFRVQFVAFLEETTAWPNVKAIGIKPKGHVPGTPLDYTRYLRVRRLGSQYGAFAYTYPVDGLVHLRLNVASEEELKAVAPAAWLTPQGHREYGVAIRIKDDETLKQALELARQAYDAT